FPDKAALFTAIAAEGFALLAAAIEDAVRRAGPDAGAAQRFGAAGRAYAGFALAHPAHFAVMWQPALLHGAAPALAAAGDATFALLLGGVREVQAEGGAPGADPETVAYLAWSTVHGLAALWLGGPLQQAGRPFDELAGEVATLLGRAFIPPAPPPPPDPPPPPRGKERSQCTVSANPTAPGCRPGRPTPACGSATPSAGRSSTSWPTTTRPGGSPWMSSSSGCRPPGPPAPAASWRSWSGTCRPCRGRRAGSRAGPGGAWPP